MTHLRFVLGFLALKKKKTLESFTSSLRDIWPVQQKKTKKLKGSKID